MKGTIFVVTDKPGKQWKRSDGVIVSDEGENVVPCRFDGAARGTGHYEAHNKEYPGLTQDQYIQKAAILAASSAGNNIPGFSTDDGCIVRYDKTDNDFSMAYPGHEGYVHTTAPGNFDICPICKWEDDNLQRADTELDGGANEISLNQAKKLLLFSSLFVI